MLYYIALRSVTAAGCEEINFIEKISWAIVEIFIKLFLRPVKTLNQHKIFFLNKCTGT